MPAGAAGRRTAPGANALLAHRAVKPAVFVLALLPAAELLYRAVAGGLGPNPAESLLRGSGDWVLRMLCLTLAVTPLRRWTGWTALIRLRRMLGLFTFFYALVHLLCYAWLDMGFDLAAIVRDLPKRPFVLAGASAFALLLPLAATSFDAAIRRLGGARWRRLHRLVYAVAALAVLHFFWMRSAKHDFAEVAAYAVVLGVLLGDRVLAAWRVRRARALTS